jgi:methionyl-tRNA synthetase
MGFTRRKDWEPTGKIRTLNLVHFIGKDNIVFIASSSCDVESRRKLYFARQRSLQMSSEPKEINYRHLKNWAVWLHEYLERVQNQQDVLRYALTSNAPETKDNDFTWKDFQARNNNRIGCDLREFH